MFDRPIFVTPWAKTMDIVSRAASLASRVDDREAGIYCHRRHEYNRNCTLPLHAGFARVFSKDDFLIDGNPSSLIVSSVEQTLCSLTTSFEPQEGSTWASWS